MKTRKQYIAGECSHDEYYSQFVTPFHLSLVLNRFGERITKSTDPHFNDIPLVEWDQLTGYATGRVSGLGATEKLRAAGDNVTAAGMTCILKRAAKMIRSEEV